jgi:Pectinacetylesterase
MHSSSWISASSCHRAASFETAVCAPAAAYYFRPGSGSGATRWLIRFQGGAWCTDTGSCQLRMDTAPWLMSSKLYPVRDFWSAKAAWAVAWFQCSVASLSQI